MILISPAHIRIDVNPGGHSFTMAAYEAVDVPEPFVPGAIIQGARPDDGSISPENPPTEVPAEDHSAELADAIAELVAKGDPADFKKRGDGSPLIGSVRALVDFDVTQDELSAAWESVSAGE